MNPAEPRTAPTTTLTRRRLLAAGATAALATACGVPDSGGSTTGLKAATYLTPAYKDLFPSFGILLDGIKKASGGKVTFQLFHSESLLDADQLIPGLLQGVTDLGFQTSSYISTTYKVLGAYELPFVSEGVEAQQRALRPDGELYKVFNEELGKKGLRVIGSMPTSFETIWTVDKPIRKPEDIKGMRIRTAGHVEGETVRALGGSPVSMSSAELFQALERGTIDGMISYLGTIFSRDLQQVIRYATMGRFGSYSLDAYVRKRWYDQLDDAGKQALLTAGKEYLEKGTANQIKVHKEQYEPALDKAGIEVIEPKGAELAAFEDALKPVEQRWRNQLGDPALADKALGLVRNA
ncbi:MAG: hypothetical protein GEV11_14150 [Streptosporangiales bacterium]|nr:hypothetical protein [Streptosporangiales bacterium]